jgi:hypothetical protein
MANLQQSSHDGTSSIDMVFIGAVYEGAALESFRVIVVALAAWIGMLGILVQAELRHRTDLAMEHHGVMCSG